MFDLKINSTQLTHNYAHTYPLALSRILTSRLRSNNSETFYYECASGTSCAKGPHGYSYYYLSATSGLEIKERRRRKEVRRSAQRLPKRNRSAQIAKIRSQFKFCVLRANLARYTN